MFSSAVLGRAFAQLRQRYGEGLEATLGVLENFTSEEMSHLVGVIQRRQGTVNETALADCIRTIRGEYQAGNVSSDDDLLALQSKLKEKKGLK